MSEILKSTYMTSKVSDLNKKIDELAFKVFLKDPNGAELLQCLFDYYLNYVSPMDGGLRSDSLTITHTVGGQDMIRRLFNHAKSGEEETKKASLESMKNEGVK